ncbi:anti-sigma factor [Streptomyces sp. SL13]|jgi:anti-sigma factor RsiW|uniref:Regulator of SigK n=1 Tax=Streptantibioticus silvisoli TaxID=2705255 RepID=A0AA90H4F1_9ACTN|nr:anti-sigma factor [Streptantibioticus silvisoli]MDI5961956.1 anti-sigma factor [Streptantibioticus silvisoli]MDI5970504.1 anti-sigma factor [Streptantibioticus silvisoli]
MTADLHTLTGAYALDALSPEEAREFARHLTECDVCTHEVAELRETAARLALAVAEVPPAALRARVMAAIPEVRQLPPPGRVADVVPLRGRAWRQRLPYLALAACLVGAAVAGGVAVNAEHDVDRQRTQAEQQASDLASLMAAPDAAYHTTAVHGGGNATVVSSVSQARTAFVYRDLPKLAGSHVYELWYSRKGSMVPAGLVDSGRPSGTAVLAGAASGADGVGLTVEPHGGSKQPTTSPLMLVSIAG